VVNVHLLVRQVLELVALVEVLQLEDQVLQEILPL
tara:strand:+ start:254 stop:358 length:105 start_codon:yes stop_codon:yes gene_type:complete